MILIYIYLKKKDVDFIDIKKHLDILLLLLRRNERKYESEIQDETNTVFYFSTW